MARKHLMIDLDGTVVNTYGQQFCDRALRLTGKRVTVEQLTTYQFTEVTDLTTDDLIKIFASADFYRNLYPLVGAVEGLQVLARKGYGLHYLTVRPTNNDVRAETLEWLAKYRVPYNSIHILEHKDGPKEKARITKALGLDYFVEDNAAVVAELARVCETGFFINAPHNKNDAVPANVMRVDNFQSIVKILDEIEVSDAIQTNKLGAKVRAA